jgi:hypothetical protein
MTAAQLLMECRSRGIRLQRLDNGQLDVDAPEKLLTADLLARLREHKPELLTILAGDPQEQPETDAAGWLERIDANGRTSWTRADVAALEVIDFPTPCEVCGAFDRWQDLRGGWHCARCEPRKTGPRLRKLAYQLRWQYGISAPDLQPRTDNRPKGRQWPPVVPDNIAADPYPACSDCGRPVIPGQPGRPAGLCVNCWMKGR